MFIQMWVDILFKILLGRYVRLSQNGNSVNLEVPLMNKNIRSFNVNKALAGTVTASQAPLANPITNVNDGI